MRNFKNTVLISLALNIGFAQAQAQTPPPTERQMKIAEGALCAAGWCQLYNPLAPSEIIPLLDEAQAQSLLQEIGIDWKKVPQRERILQEIADRGTRLGFFHLATEPASRDIFLKMAFEALAAPEKKQKGDELDSEAQKIISLVVTRLISGQVEIALETARTIFELENSKPLSEEQILKLKDRLMSEEFTHAFFRRFS
jgi:hypothetical protein